MILWGAHYDWVYLEFVVLRFAHSEHQIQFMVSPLGVGFYGVSPCEYSGCHDSLHSHIGLTNLGGRGFL